MCVVFGVVGGGGGGGVMDNIGWNRFSETKISNQVTLV